MEDLKLEAFQFPLLLKDPDVKKLYEGIMKSMLEINNAKFQLDKRIEEIRGKCTHVKTTEKREDTRGRNWLAFKPLTSKICTDCGLTILRPKGKPSEICENCWGPMEYLGQQPGQGEHISHYECKMCGHHHTET